MRRRRNAVAAAEAARASGAIADQLSTLLHGVELIGAFASHDNEVDLWPLYASWLADGQRLAFPRVVAPTEMVFCEVANLDELAPGAFGIREPVTAPVDAALLGAVLVPAVAFDRAGRRLGFGGGYYDRLLGAVLHCHQEPPRILGVGYHWQLLDEPLPAEPWDVRVHRIITDAEIWDI